MNLAWVPNSLTLGNLLLGFMSIVIASHGGAPAATIAGALILGAALLDGFDGQAARALKVTSPLGAELDSLADCVAFGVAPGYLAYKAYLSGIIVSGIAVPYINIPFDFGIFIAALFPICAAYRLARFNVNSDSKSFTGLPSPIAGIIVAVVPIFIGDVILADTIYRVIFAVLFSLVALLMVSTVRYSKPQATFFQRYIFVKIVLLLAIFALLVLLFREWSVFIVLALYILSGLVSFIIQFIQDHKY
ncbi:MAG TPA: CDP-alcohol phosphatidyltransferase family protein [Spirochaetota bacterium]|nr:CDP-alcohol phosphatidyltransferase family protein [Spirochaetota bacterium]HNT11269.1 CDP-alcohol phosphatidyltransferase family protein [Spirochaetota bacterium]HNV45576.1 CDP-alcohol phosphatidyltransferase family protein [Spirochaetota bacterium]HOS38656.1 CDP-alcohol phosphatidyltransferase family protein [Spirochaetota bacterium]HPU87502.1 CDP-alcohol phosphatidyltransferase family protein [Spirochaetota bacterium]